MQLEMFRNPTKNTVFNIYVLAYVPQLAIHGSFSWLLCALTSQANVAAGIDACVTWIV